MPIQVSYPGVYVQEIPGGQPAVAGVSTASTAFVDFFARGPMDQAMRVASMQDVERQFGGLHTQSEASYGLRQYFLNGGQEAWVVRTGDGKARKAFLKIKIRTPGLPARVKASFDDFLESKKAAEAAVKAAEAASAALAALQKDGITDQEREEGGNDLRGNADRAAEATNQAAEATRKAAVQARAASDELALAIAKVAAASGPVADRTAMAAHKAADGANASSDAAKATADIAAVAQRALGVAEAALKAGANSRAVIAASTDIQNVLDAVAASKASADGAAKELENAKLAKDLTSAQVAAERAAAGAAEAAAQAQIAAENAAAAAQGVIDKLKVQKADTAAAQKALDDANAAITAAKDAAKEAGEADWDAQTAADLAAAQAAADRGSKAAATAADVAEKNAQAAAVSLLATVLTMGSTAAADAAHIAGKETADGTPEPINPVVFDAIKAINDSIDAAKRAAAAAKGGAQDAKVAADSVTSGIPMLSARAAENSAGKAQKATVEIIQQANATKLQVNSASMKALAAVKPAKDASEAAKAAPAAPADGVATALAAGKAGLMAADSALAAAEAVEKAAVATSQVSVQASMSADVAAQAAQAAVFANEEANQDPTLTVEAINEGEWGDNLEVTLTVNGTIFDLAVRELVVQNGVARQLNGESYSTITLEDSAPANKKALEMVNHNSNLVRLSQLGPKIEGAYPDEMKGKFLDNGDNGGLASADQLVASMYALDGIEPALFNLLCLPAVGNYDDAQASVAISQAHAYCGKKRAFLIVDIPAKVKTVGDMQAWAAGYGNAKAYNMAVYFPRLIIPDPLNEYRPRNIGPSGTMAGIYSRTDTARGVWKAPAGVEAVIQGAEVAVRLNDDLNGLLNPLGLNVLRSFPVYGQIVWGARTLAGADPLSSEYKYINVRRLMNYVEESIFRSMKWAVFEPNNESLWSKIRLQINGFLSGLYAQGAFQGSKPASAYFVRCDGTTTTPLDIDLGIVNVFVGIAPAKPAEFIILNFQQIAGQTA